MAHPWHIRCSTGRFIEVRKCALTSTFRSSQFVQVRPCSIPDAAVSERQECAHKHPRGNRLRDERGGLGYVRGGPATRFTSGPLPGRVPVVDTQQPAVVTDGLHTPVTPSPSQPPARLGPGPCRSARSLPPATDGAGSARRGVDQPTGDGNRPLGSSLRHANTRPGRKGADDDGLLGPIARCLTPAASSVPRSAVTPPA
jgi:hypothetical protein